MKIAPLTSADVMSAMENLKRELSEDMTRDGETPENIARVLAGVEKDYRQFAATKG